MEQSAKEVFKSFTSELVADEIPKIALTKKAKQRISKMKGRSSIKIGMPRVLNMYSLTPVFTGYFESLGIPSKNLIFSDFTTEKLYKEGAKRGSVDPCFPSKLAIPHVHNLLFEKHLIA